MRNLRRRNLTARGKVDCESRLDSRIQFEPEHAPRPDRAFDANQAAHHFNQPLAHHQADARAFLCAGLPAQTIERLKQLQYHFRSQSRPSVSDAYSDTLRNAGVTVDYYSSIRLVVFDRVR